MWGQAARGQLSGVGLGPKRSEVQHNSCSCWVFLQCAVIVKWFKVISSALNVHVNFLCYEMSVVYLSNYTHVYFLVTSPYDGSFHTVKEVGIPGSFWIQSRHIQCTLRCTFSVGDSVSEQVTAAGESSAGSRWVPVHPLVHLDREHSSQERLRLLLFSSFKSALRQLPSGYTFVQLSSKCKTLTVREIVFNYAFKNLLC